MQTSIAVFLTVDHNDKYIFEGRQNTKLKGWAANKECSHS